MMRKTSLLFLGALVGVVATLLLTQPHTLLLGSAARAAASDTYQELNLFGDVFERVRADYSWVRPLLGAFFRPDYRRPFSVRIWWMRQRS
jgi:hypothetical protein